MPEQRPFSLRQSTSLANSPPGSANPTVTSLDSIRNDPRTPQREWSLFETILLEGEEHPLRRQESSSTLARPELARRMSRATSYFGAEDTGLLGRSLRSEPDGVILGESLFSPSRTPGPDDSDESLDDDVSPPPPSTFCSRISWIPSLTTLQRDILKCALAYLIGSLFTFNPYLSGLISDILPSHASSGPSPSGHMVATVTVYFNPAKSLGAMQEADIYCIAAALFSAFVALASMDTFWFFEIREGWEWLADALTFIWIAVAMSVLAWVKVWMNKASFNPAASMASIIIFVTVIKEGGITVLLQVAFIVLIGSVISNVICMTIWPRSASKALQSDIVNSLHSYAVLLEMLTQTFLLEEDLHPKHKNLLKAVKDHEATFTSLKRSQNEAKSEWWNSKIQRSSAAYDSAIDSMTRLAQHVGGLRSGLNLQRELALRGSTRTSTIGLNRTSMVRDETEVDALQQAFGEFVEELAPPMHALTSTCAKTLKKLRLFSQEPSPRIRLPAPQDFDELAANIRRAMFTFDSTSHQALGKMLRQDNAEFRAFVDPTSSIDDASETLCLVYFFIFNLQEFASELVSLVEIMGLIQEAERSSVGIWSKVKSWVPNLVRSKATNGGPHRPGLKGSISNLGPEGRRQTARAELFPPVKPHAPNTVNRPPAQSLSFVDRQKQRIWAISHRLREPDLKYAVKTGAATAILALPAFIDSTRDVFVQYRGEWALISFFVVMSKTIGATNRMSLHRILGTIIGAVAAASVSTLFPHQPWALAAFGFLFAIPCFRVIVGQPEYATSGRFVLLTYNLTCLFRYNMRAEETSVWTIALHRSMAVTIGVVWALFVSRWWWPSEARRELSRGLSELCLNMSWLYTSLVRTWPARESLETRLSIPETIPEHEDEDPERQPLSRTASGGIPAPSAEVRKFMEMELHLQLHLLELQRLVVQAEAEFRLKGPFPVALYRGILASLQTILDNLHSIRCVSMREEWRTTVHVDIMRSVQSDRRAMIGNILLFFSTLSAAFGLKAPLPAYLPPAEDARQRLLEAIHKYVVARQLETHGSSSRQLLYIAYALMMKSVVSELQYLGSTLQEAYGVIGGGSFEEMFGDTAN